MELLDISCSTVTIEDAKELPDERWRISNSIFSIGLKISKLLSSATEAPTTPVREGICLLKISIPTFDGHILQWPSFWGQFELYVHVHNRAELSDAINLAYLRDAMKDGLTVYFLEGLAQTADNYSEAVSCLRQCNDRPCLIHLAHVYAILNIPLLIDGNGMERC